MKVFKISQLKDFLSNIDRTNLIKDKQKYYYNIPMSFDIETSSFYVDKDNNVYSNDYIKINELKKVEKRAIMYVWQFAINDNVIIGRTWNDFILLCDSLYNYLDLSNKRYIIVYVHNLSYEFQFMCKWFKWIEIFADSERKPIKAVNDKNIIFKCSYRLSGYSLAVLANNLQKHSIKKLVGDLDYNLIRHSKTPLSFSEIEYCINDVLIVTAYISEQIEDYGNIVKIPLTQTGKVRRYVRAKCFENDKYKFLIQKLTIDDTEYLLLKNAFAGGFTHCNAMYTDNICEDVTSYDFTSSYPTVLIEEKFPMSKGKQIKIKDVKQLEKLIENYSVLVDVEFINIQSTFLYDNIISYSKCRNIQKPLINNGRVVSADKLTITLTDVDYLNLKKFYKWDNAKIGLCYIYTRDYLPKEIIETILKLYNDKTKLKGVKGKEVEYLHSKELLNSLYGMSVTSIIHDTYNFTDKWETIENNLHSELEKYNNDKNRFLFYQWGVWCTAYARNNLFTGIIECKSDYIYSDTDSIKILNANNHLQYFEKYNKWITGKLEKCLKHYNLDISLLCPETVKGIKKPLGIWDYDGHYKQFKTLGAKRYIVSDDDNNLHITVCGLSKKSGRDYIKEQKEPIRFFNNGMYIDRDHTGKMIHTYIDDECKGDIIDYKGNKYFYYEKSFIHLEKTDYILSLTSMYINYYLGLQKLYK